MALSPSEIELVDRLRRQLDDTSRNDERLLRYYQGRQRIAHLGMAIPPSMRDFLVLTDWARVVIDTKADRQQVRALILPGEETADPQLRRIADASNLDMHVGMFNRDRMVYGRGFLSVGANEENASLPLIRVESPREMTALVDVRHERVIAAARFYGVDPVTKVGPVNVTLYLPNETVWIEKRGERWYEVDRDVHNLGAVPVIMHLNRRMSASWDGVSEIPPLASIMDAAARSLTLMQFAQEAHGIPGLWATGVTRGDFVDEAGQPIPQFEAYFDAIKMLSNPSAKWGQFSAADLKNFETALEVYGKQASIVTGFPARYFGLLSVNPPAEGAIRADEAQLVRGVEAQNEQVGMTLGWAAALALRFATGEWVTGNRVKVEWFDPATPTISQREDALAKRRAAGVLSMEGYWDELGWSEARKAKEREYLRLERLADQDPYLSAVRAKDAAVSNAVAPVDG